MKTLLKLLSLLAMMVLAGSAPANSITGRYATITIDGNMSDWLSTDVMYPASQIGAGAPLNSTFTNAFVCNDTNNLYVALQTAGPAAITSNWTYNLYLDTDMNPSTGFNAGWMTGGYDRLVQYGSGGTTYSVFSFTGAAQNLWGWNFNNLITYSYSASTIEWAIPLSALGMTTNQLRMEFNVTGGDVTVETWAHLSEANVGTFTLGVIPEPLSLGLLAVGALVFFQLRRRA